MYSTVRVVASTLRSDHKAIVVYATQSVAGYKAKYTKLFRPISPAQHAQFPQYISAFVSADDWSYIDTMDTQDAFNEFYDAVLGLINYFYPERTITVTTTDPYYITPASKVKLRRKNRLRRAGRVQEADALAAQIGRDIANRNKTRLSKIHRKTSSKDLWAAVRQLTGGRQTTDNVEGAQPRRSTNITRTSVLTPIFRCHSVSTPMPVVGWTLCLKCSECSTRFVIRLPA